VGLESGEALSFVARSALDGTRLGIRDLAGHITRTKRLDWWKMRAETMCVGLTLTALALLGAGCATYEARDGRSGPVAWERVDQTRTASGGTSTLVLREAAGLGITFTTLKTTVPVPSTGYGIEYYGGIGEQPFAHRLPAKGELRTRFNVAASQRYMELEF
jgi:hypothetical protein